MMNTLIAGLNNLYADRCYYVDKFTIAVYSNHDFGSATARLRQCEARGWLRILKDPQEAGDEEICVELLDWLEDPRSGKEPRPAGGYPAAEMPQVGYWIEPMPSDFSVKPDTLNCVQVVAKIRNSQRPRFVFADDSHRITGQAAASAGLSADELGGLQECYDAMRAELREVMLGKSTEIPGPGKKVGGVVYRIEPFFLEGEAIFDRFIRRMEDVIGVARAWELTKSVPVERLAGQFGFCGAVLEFGLPRPEGLERYMLQPASCGLILQSGQVGMTYVTCVRTIDTSFFGLIGYWAGLP